MGSAIGAVFGAVAGPIAGKLIDAGAGLLGKLVDGIFGGDKEKAQAGVQNTANKTALDGLQQAMDFAGVPKFLQQQVMDAASNALPQNSSVDAQQQQACDDHTGTTSCGRSSSLPTRACVSSPPESPGCSCSTYR